MKRNLIGFLFKILGAIFVVCLIAGGAAAIKAKQFQTMMAAGKARSVPPETVSSALVREEKWINSITTIGTITAVQGVTVTPDIPGVVKAINFESGTLVAKGALLVRLDISSEEAQLRAIEAQVELAQLNLTRIRTLREQNTVSQSDLDNAVASLKQFQANADTIRATIEKKTIRAPFAGRLGIRQVNLGQYLETGKPIVSLQALSPVYVDFSLPQQELSRIKNGLTVRLKSDAYPSNVFEGTLTAINPDLNQSTRSVGVQATFRNEDQTLRPGMFAHVEVLVNEDQTVLAVPRTSVLSAPYGDSVYVIESKPGTDGITELTVRQQFVQTGRALGDFINVESGLKAGDKIVSAGIFKLRNGMAVVESNATTPKSETSPKPTDS